MSQRCMLRRSHSLEFGEAVFISVPELFFGSRVAVRHSAVSFISANLNRWQRTAWRSFS